MWNGARGSGYFFEAQEKYKSVCGEDNMLNIVADGRGCLGILNVVQFANGFVFSTQRSHEQHSVRPFTFHATYSNDKLMSLRQEGVFYDSADHYSIPGGVLVYDPQLRMDLFHSPLEQDAVEGFYTPQSHMLFVQYQLQQLRIAFAIAKTLGRTVVLPRMACICQCFFFPGKNCNIDGHRVRLPHVCPTDHWLRPGRLKLPHREPGFLVRRKRESGRGRAEAKASEHGAQGRERREKRHFVLEQCFCQSSVSAEQRMGLLQVTLGFLFLSSTEQATHFS